MEEESEEEEDSDLEEEDGDEEESQAFVPGSHPLEEGEELVMDEGAYVLYHQASLGPPCLSFDLVEGGGEDAAQFPLTLFGVAGSQAEKASDNSIIAFKMFNLHPIKQRDEDREHEEEEEEEGEDDPAREPKLKVASIRHNGAINRIR